MRINKQRDTVADLSDVITYPVATVATAIHHASATDAVGCRCTFACWLTEFNLTTD